jgi:peroxiredoxin Q/BCP
MSFFNLNALSVGDKAPDFSLRDQDGNLRTLSEFKGSCVVLYFYPKDNTPGCTKEACSLRDNFNAFKDNNTVIIGVSYDSPKSHKAFLDKYHLPFILLSDSDKSVAKKYGAKNAWFLPVPRRMTFVIDKNGIICAILPKVDVSTHAAEILAIITGQPRP